MNKLKIENLKTANAVNAPANSLKIDEKFEDTSADATKQVKEQEEKAVVKHVVIYLGNGEYTDRHGYKWHKGTEHTYSDKEYCDRSDLHFMVQYGEMKHTTVTI